MKSKLEIIINKPRADASKAFENPDYEDHGLSLAEKNLLSPVQNH